MVSRLDIMMDMEARVFVEGVILNNMKLWSEM